VKVCIVVVYRGTLEESLSSPLVFNGKEGG